MADEFLTQELPAIRRAQERSLVALKSIIWLVGWGLWRDWAGGEIICLKGRVASLGPRVRRTAAPTDSRDELSLATFAVCLDAIDSITEARGIMWLSEADTVRRNALALRERMISGLMAVSDGLVRTQSRAFGDNDPLTASWILPILLEDSVRITGRGPAKRVDQPETRLGKVDLFTNMSKGLERLTAHGEYMIEGGGNGRQNNAEEHAWPASLAVRALNLLTRGQPESAISPRLAEDLRAWSEQQVRLQLAGSVTGEAGQDAAHLAAALSMAMWLEELPLPLLEAAVKELCTMQRPDGSLVLTRPYFVDMDGRAITPLPADVTLAMIAVADQLNARYPEHPTVLRIERQLLEAVQRQREAYFRSAVRTDGLCPSGEEALLWSSDRAKPSPGMCDTWATARTVTALVMILNLESRLITRRLLEESRFSYRRGREIEKGFDELVDPELRDMPASGPRNDRLSPPVADSADVTNGGHGGAPVRRVDRTVVSALRDGLTATDDTKMRSVLLCGPPGTSKTSLVEAVAKKLDEDLVERRIGRYVVYLVQLSPADFLLDGPNRVEQRAKRIFDYLTQMEHVIVIFDEIDRLVLDRSAPEYQKQGDVFQFMTPSMLPKLTALRQRGSVVSFAIATNYADRIDPAIARKGRIDESFVIAPPNLYARLQILGDMPLGKARRLAAVTPLWVYGDLKTLGKAEDPKDVMQRGPSGSLASYKSRRFSPRKEILANEILQIAGLYLEGDGPAVLDARGPDEIGAIPWALEHVSRDKRKKTYAEMIKRLDAATQRPFEPWPEKDRDRPAVLPEEAPPTFA
jgi:ATPase family protein associated with various cellular activities (AAA)